VLLAIAGDSAAGKTTLTEGLVQALGDRCVSVCVDDYYRYDRQERKGLAFTALHPDCNYLEIMNSTCSCWPLDALSSNQSMTTEPVC
jgi:phosphoribulokinase